MRKTKTGAPVQAWQTMGILILIAMAATACGSGNGAVAAKRPAVPVAAASSPHASQSASRAASRAATERPAVSVAAAVSNPCLLVTLADARAILGPGTVKLPGAGSALPSTPACNYGSTDTAQAVTVQVLAVPPKAFSSVFVPHGVAVAGVGHGAVCAADSELAGTYNLLGAIDSFHALTISAPSCDAAAKAAVAAFAKLG